MGNGLVLIPTMFALMKRGVVAPGVGDGELLRITHSSEGR